MSVWLDIRNERRYKSWGRIGLYPMTELFAYAAQVKDFQSKPTSDLPTSGLVPNPALIIARWDISIARNEIPSTRLC
jgi:hypothetical protein